MLGLVDVLEILNRLVAGVQILGLGEELLLDQTRRGEAEHGVGGTRLVVCTGGAGAAERLLADESGCCLAVWSDLLAYNVEMVLSGMDSLM